MKSNSTQIRTRAAIIVWSFILIIGSAGFAVQAQYPNQYPNQYPVQYPNDPNRRDDRYDRNRRGRTWDSYPNWGGSFDLRQTALNAGYNEGMKDGTNARNRNRNNDYASQPAYRKATKDYSSRLGNRELYRRYFREAYQTGFADGLGSNTNYGTWNRNNQGRNNDTWDRDRNNDGVWDRNNRRGRNWDRYDNYGGSFDLRQTALNAGYNEGIKEGRDDRGRGQTDFRNNSAYQEATKDYSSRLGDRELYRRYYRAGYENGYYDGLNGF